MFLAWLEKHRRFVLMLAAALALGGIAAAVLLPIGLYPEANFPRVRITVDTGSQPAAQMVQQVTQPIEQVARAVPGVVDVTSTTSRGSAQIIINFAWGSNMTAATLGVNAAVAQLLPVLPASISYTVLRMDPTVFPFMAFALTSSDVPPVTLQDIAKLRLVPQLSAVAGVARVQVQGGGTGEIEVRADPARLAAYHVTLDELSKAITQADTLQSVGQLQDHNLLYLLMASNPLTGVSDVKNVVVRGGPKGVVRVGDVAQVSLGAEPRLFSVSADGKQAVTLMLFQQPGSNMVSIAHRAAAALQAYRPDLPPGVTLSTWYDQSTLVLAAASSVRDAIVIGVILAALVLLAFLRSFRVTLLAMLIVPASLAVAVLVLFLLGMSFNIMTLGGLAASVGLVIDDVIVMIEHIARRSAAETGPARSWVLRAGAEFLRPLTFSSAATLVVFAPLGFLSGVTGTFFKALSITMAATLAASWALTAFAVPLLAETLVDFSAFHDPEAAHASKLVTMHHHLLRNLFRRPLWLAVAGVVLLLLGGFSLTRVATGFMPHIDEGGFVLDYQTEPGTSLTETAREIGQVEEILRADPAVASFSTRIGAGFGGDMAEPNTGDIVVRLKPLNQRAAIGTVMDRIGNEVALKVPGVDTDIHQLIGDELGDLTGVPQPIEIKLAGADPAELANTAQRVADAISGIKGVNSVINGITPAGDAIDINVDPARAAMKGLDPAAVAAQVQTAMAGSIVGETQGVVPARAIRVRLSPGMVTNTDDLGALPIATPSGALVPLGQIASFTVEQGQPEITRENLQQVVNVTARLNGRGLSAGIADVKTALGKPGVLGPGVTYTLGGVYAQQQQAFAGLARVFIAALAAEFLLLLFLYERFSWVLAIMGTSLLSTTAVFTGLYVTGIELNITALMGMVMIVGIATEMAIFYVSEFVHLHESLPLREALVAASTNRLRPIAMTTLAAILTLLPLALDLGQGAGMQQPLAVAIIAGLLVQFPLVLLALPVVLALLTKVSAGR
ncbi:efflux RND transporter permease subunit [Acidocella sp. KAb 2-4]|uniref:efflux RND transporter permease subunit n=1 Tax=Acidocella sp. KAb 2-4 TaxID=2885158 RepID=UPI001D06EBE5|nr:efflux RND transporter permease subunit [Acidocella sp. KAb 2-4]MCB5943959.1 efflux RND transporter permease subunit [Acidocella sp. KAb 2-4]